MKRLRWNACWPILVMVAVTMEDAVDAQDVAVQGRPFGAEPPQWVVDVLQQSPNAFKFEFAWKEKARRVRERRAVLLSREMPTVITPSFLVAAQAAVDGTLSVPVVAALYPDVTTPHTQSQIQDRLFGSGSGTVSVTELYEEMSGDVFSVAGAVSPWLSLPQNRSYYEPVAGTGDRRGNLWEFLRDALVLADPDIDFGQYDNDGPDGVPNSGDDDGYVDVTAFLYATVAMSCGGTNTGIWPHRWAYRVVRLLLGDGVYAAYSTNDESANGGMIQVNDYILQSAVRCNGTSLMGSGTMSHELGHALDLPDLYDTDTEDGTNSAGIGVWGLMSSGNYNVETSPAHMCAWSKDQLGWLTVTTAQNDVEGLILEPIQTSRSVVRIDLPESEEYLLLSDRQPLGSDEYLPGSGLLIWHIDPAITALRYDVNADANHKGVDLEEADGLAELDSKSDYGDTGDPYPGSTDNTQFTSQTNPSSRAYGPALCTVGIRGISESGGQIQVNISVSERYAFWGDTDGSEALDWEDVSQAYFYAMGYRDPAVQVFLPNGDVDADEDVDIRDGFIVASYLNGIVAPGSRTGDVELLPCTPSPSPSSSQPATEGGVTSKSRRPGGSP